MRLPFLSNLWNRKKSHVQHDCAFLYADMHNHLVPGIDDGAPTVEVAVALVGGMCELGYQCLWLTPHVHRELYPNTAETIQPAFEVLQAAVQRAGLSVQLHVAAEYYVDDWFETLLEKGSLLTLPQRHVLIELSFFAAPPRLEEILFQMRIKGYRPILAHPERYGYFTRQGLKPFERLRQLGCKLQVNLLSLAGTYGKEVQHFAQKMLQKGYVDLIGTDVHHEAHLSQLQQWLRRRGLRIPQGQTLINATLLGPTVC